MRRFGHRDLIRLVVPLMLILPLEGLGSAIVSSAKRFTAARGATPPLISSTASATTATVAGKFDVGGYKLHLTCIGEGSPTVVLEAGRNQTWSTWNAVRGEVATFTRVCSYDHAGLGESDVGPTTRTSQTDVDALHALLGAAAIPGPHVIVGYGLGGLNVRLYASQYPDEVVGVVLLDALHEDTDSDILALLPRQQGKEFLEEVHEDNPKDFDFTASAAQLRAAAKLHTIPLVVLSPKVGYPCDHDWPCAKIEVLRKQRQDDMAKLVPNGTHTIVSSGHFIHQDQPQIVIAAIRNVIAAVRGR